MGAKVKTFHAKFLNRSFLRSGSKIIKLNHIISSVNEEGWWSL